VAFEKEKLKKDSGGFSGPRKIMKNAASARGWGAGSYRNCSELAERLPRGR